MRFIDAVKTWEQSYRREWMAKGMIPKPEFRLVMDCMFDFAKQMDKQATIVVITDDMKKEAD